MCKSESTYLVASHVVTLVHDQRFTSLVVLSNIQTPLRSWVSYLVQTHTYNNSKIQLQLCNMYSVLYLHKDKGKSDLLLHIFLELGLEWRPLGRLCLDTRWSSCTAASLSISDDQKCLRTCSVTVKVAYFRLQDAIKTITVDLIYQLVAAGV